MSNSWIDPSWNINVSEPAPSVALSSHSNVFLLIESSLMPNWKVELYKHVNRYQLSSPNYVRLFEDTHYQHLPDGPVLIEVTGTDYSDLLEKWLKQFETTPLGCVFITSLDIDWQTLQIMLRGRLTMSNNGAQTLVRYYDPRTLLPMISSLTAEERSMFLPQMKNIYWHYREWLYVDLPDLNPHQSRPQQQSSWVLSTDHIKKN